MGAQASKYLSVLGIIDDGAHEGITEHRVITDP